MAKNKVNIDVDIDDKGDLKKLGRNAKDAGKNLEKGAKGAHSMDRRTRGAAAMSSSATKNFSKMSQGISGGLVPAYATLAASLFAIDAAFRALKRASDLRVQRAGMEAYAATTGIALKSIAKDLQAATGYQLDFKEAAESASIAISAGFSADQVTQIGKAAKMASIALGRDFADSYQRLLKGITKAEPELLDELGIILRLEKATKVYAATIGKTAQDLTAYERQQAVFNEVIDQVADKYAAVGDSIPVSVMGQLGAKMTDLTDTFLTGIAPIAEFFGSVLVNSTTAAVAALGIFAASILKNVIPPLDQMMIKAKAAWSAAKGQGKAAWGSMKGIGSEFGNAKRIMTGTSKKGLSGAQAMAKGGMKGAKGAGLESLRKGGGLTKGQLAGLKKSLKHAEAQWKQHGAIVSGNLAGMNIKNVKSMQASLVMMEASHIKFFAAVKVGYKALATTAVLAFRTIRAAWKATAASMRVVAAGLGAALNKALGIIGWIGMIVMAKDIFADMANSWDKILKSIGGMIQKVGEWIKNLARHFAPDSIIGRFMKWAGERISAGGVIVIEHGQRLEEKLEAKRRQVAFAGQAELAAKNFIDRTAEVVQQQVNWEGLEGTEGFSKRAAETQMLASTGGLQDFANMWALEKKRVEYGTTAGREGAPDVSKYSATEREQIKSGLAIEADKDLEYENKLRLREKYLIEEEGLLQRFAARRAKEEIKEHITLDPKLRGEERTQIIAEDEFKSMTDSLNVSTPALIAHYKHLGKTDEGYTKVAEAIEAGKWKEAKDGIVKLTNQYGSHVQALKDMKSAEEGRNKRIAEYITKTQELGKYGQEVKTLAKSMLELTGQFDETVDLEKFREFYGEAAVGKITKLADAQAYATARYLEQLEAVEKLRNAKTSLAHAELAVAEASGGAALFRSLAAEKMNLLNIEIAYLEFKRTETANRQIHLDAVAKLEMDVATRLKEGGVAMTEEEALSIKIDRDKIKRINTLIEAKRVGWETEKVLITDMGKLRQSFKESFVDGISKGIEGLINGTKSLKEAFADMAKGILASMAKVLAQMMTEKLLKNAFGGFFATGRSGGVFSPPGYRSFQGGGISTGNSGPGYLAKLHGTEAVVPLGNDRSIPVTMKGGVGNTNNTSVTVNVAEGGASSEVTGESRGALLGNVIANAIEERLQDEQRPGGILYRPGGG